MMKRAILCFFVLVCLSFSASTAFAQITIGVGVKGGLNASLVEGVPEDEAIPFNETQSLVDPDFFPMFGIGGGIGATVEARALGYIGLETGFHVSFDNGSGNEEINNQMGQRVLTVNQDQRTTAWHFPILLKLAIPFPVVTPVFGLGVEVVSQSDSEIEYDVEAFNVNRDIETSTYTLFMLTAGLEFKVDPIRIPLELRLGYNVGFDSTASERVSAVGEDINSVDLTYNGVYQGHIGLFTGIVYDFDIML